MIAPNEATWDALVIGGGLAGAVAAARLADSGARVLLVEAKRFPRAKTCGGCLNPRAVDGLEEAGFGDVLRGCEPAPIDRIDLRCGGRSLQLPLPPGQGVTRETLDAAMLDEVRRRGATVCEGVRARVAEGIANDERTVTLKSNDGKEETHNARLVLACDGLGHPSLSGVAGFDTVVAENSRAGVGVVIDDPAIAARYPAGVITMAVSPEGYVGLAICERGRLNLAAAFDPHTLREADTTTIVNRVLAAAGSPLLPTDLAIAWKGSARLSQHTPRVAGERLLLLGDAAGYVEPFTGEGMAAAIEGANAATPLALRAIEDWRPALVDEWQTLYTKRVRRGQNACRALAWMLKRPWATRVGLQAAAVAPGIGRAVASKVCAG